MKNDYIFNLSLMLSWFKDHANDIPKYYEYTMRELITSYSFEQLLRTNDLQKTVENNIIRLIEDNKIFIKEHLEKTGVITSYL